ncbi:MAG: hypothetical protein ACTSPQ_14460 [Candidatus Helarchaeota archaeon]
MTIYWSILIPVNAQVVDIWGVSQGSKRAFDYYEIYTGSISSTTSYPRKTFSVAKIFDNDDNNYTELLLEITSTNMYGLPSTTTQIMNDNESSYPYYVLMIDHTNYQNVIPLVPVIYNGTDKAGFNWTATMELYNTAVANWNMSISNNIATLNSTTNGTESGADYNVSIIIKWEVNTGWLVSYNEIKTYNETLGYSVHYQIKIYVPTTEFAFDWTIFYSIIGIGLGAVAIIFAYLAYRKLKRV